jgi:glycosyltransferase involved in cell wall biosynthesis
MKVLCLYNHPEYGAPMVRSESHFEAFGVTMRVIRVADETVADEADALRQLDQPFDVLLLQEPTVKSRHPEQAHLPHVTEIHEGLIECGKPVILLERVDGAQLRAARNYLDRVAGVIKSYVYRDRQDYNSVYDRAHVAMLTKCGIECSRPLHRDDLPKPLSDASLAKLRVGYSGFGCHAILQACVEAHVYHAAQRPCDVYFAGTVDYEGTEVDTHRRLALQAAQQWPGMSLASAGRRIPRPDYYAGIFASKTVLCPWGWGEASYREYEAMALGAVVIKPDTSHVESYPDIYRNGETYVPCKPDFSDAHEKIADVVENWSAYRPMRDRTRKLVVDAWQPESIARRMSELIKELAA